MVAVLKVLPLHSMHAKLIPQWREGLLRQFLRSFDDVNVYIAVDNISIYRKVRKTPAAMSKTVSKSADAIAHNINAAVTDGKKKKRGRV
jgi:hypothetical protein